LRKTWRVNSLEFTIVDMIAHHFKHVRSDDEKVSPVQPGISLSHVVFGTGTDDQMELRNLYFVVRDAVKFLHQQADPKTAANAASSTKARSPQR
jgi:hypothetical protein